MDNGINERIALGINRRESNWDGCIFTRDDLLRLRRRSVIHGRDCDCHRRYFRQFEVIVDPEGETIRAVIVGRGSIGHGWRNAGKSSVSRWHHYGKPKRVAVHIAATQDNRPRCVFGGNYILLKGDWRVINRIHGNEDRGETRILAAIVCPERKEVRTEIIRSWRVGEIRGRARESAVLG